MRLNNDEFFHRFELFQFPMDSYSKIPKKLLELKLIGASTLQVVNANNDTAVDENVQLFNAAVGGLFEISKSDTDWKIQLFGETIKSFNIILVIKDQCQFRLFTGPTVLYCSLIQNHLQFKYSTALMLRLETTDRLDCEVRLMGKEYGSVHWTPSSFNVTESLNMANVGEINELVPEMFHRCPECLLIRPDGEGHINPCPPRYTKSAPRENILSNAMTTVFKIRFGNRVVKVLNNETKMFVDAFSSSSFMNDIIEGVFSFKKLNSGTVMTYAAISIKRFSIIFAVFLRNSWRLRLRLVVTLKNGILGFPLTKILFVDNGRVEVPKEYQHNTVLLLGIHSTDDIELAIRVFANSNGLNITGPSGEFNGYTSEINWNRNGDSLSLPDQFLSPKAKQMRFASHLYQANGKVIRIADMWRQTFVKEPTMNIEQINAEDPMTSPTTSDIQETSNNNQQINAQGPMTIPAVSAVVGQNEHEEKIKTKEKIEELHAKCADVYERLSTKFYSDAIFWRAPIDLQVSFFY